MTVKEIMIGDYLRSKLHDVVSTVIYVEGEKYNSVWLEDRACWERHYMSEVEPVPLTEEILQKNFPTDEELAWWPTTKINGEAYFFHFEYARTFWCVAVELRYVHELQHLLLLCGIDKEITI